MYFIIKFWWIYWIFDSVNIVLTFPIKLTETNRDDIEKLQYQFQYVVTSGAGLLMLIICVVGCMCCKKQRNLSKGFENSNGVDKQKFNNGSTAGSERGLELEAPRFESEAKLQLKSLSVDNFVNDIKIINKPKPPILLHDDDDNNIEYDEKLTINEWLDSDLHVSRDCLKYLCEIGRGWFGKVVEGTQTTKTTSNIDNNETNNNPKSIIVRILTEEASTNEKSWFLNESLLYLKLKHKNILSLYGICIENDPYLLIFESCKFGDLKSFLIKNNNSNDLINNNVILKMTIDITSALDYMHKNDFSHTDLSARNCLVTNNLTIKLGDYGISVDKYPNDYYVVDDRALPIRWSAPESIICTDTTIVTRSITQKANIWSYSILLWEIINWGKRPYDDLCDEKVIEMILLNKYHDNLIINNDNTCKLLCLIDAMKLCWKYLPNERATLDDIQKILHDNINDSFDERWSILGNNFKELGRCTSLKELRKYNDDDDDNIMNNEIKISTSSSSILNTNQQRAIFKLGPDELIINNNQLSNESGSETEEESWRGRVERGVYTEKVKQKSKSVADLMILTHIDSDSDVELSSMASQINDKIGKKKLTTTGSVDDLRFTKLNTTKFNDELKKLRNPINNDIISKEKLDNINIKFTSTPNKINNYNNNINDDIKSNYVDVELWNNAIEYELDNKIPGFDIETITFDDNLIVNNDEKNIIKTTTTTATTPDTPQSHDGDVSVDDDDIEKINRITTCDEEERKNLSTPDDERSSDSGFRDKESCEDEDNQITTIIESLSYNSLPATSNSTTEEEQLKILYELDCILDAECSGNYEDNNYQLITKESSSNIEYNNDIQSSQLSSDNDDNNQSIIEVINNIDDTEFLDNNKLINNTDNCTNNIINNSNNNDDDESSTISLKSDNSYVSFHLDDEFVAAIRNELREKLPHAQMSIVEAPELHDDDDDKNTSINKNITPTSAWNYDDEDDDNDETKNCDFRKNIDIAIRYNIYGTPLSPIMEERESTVTSDALLSKDNSNDLSDASKLSNLPDDEVIIIDTKTNKFLSIDDDDRDTTNGDLSDDENMDYIVENNRVKYKLSSDNKFLNCGVPLPSPEEESKWHGKFTIPLANQQDVIMSTSFSNDHDWNSQDEDDEDDEDENTTDKHTDDDEDEDEDDEENSSSSGEFVWKPYDEKTIDKNDNKEIINTNELNDIKEKIDEEEAADDGDDDDDEEEEFTPSAWDATLAPHRSALRSPEKKTTKTGDQKKNVWFKKQRYHCVYEYPKETPVSDCQGQAGTTWEPTSYADWEEMMDEPKLDVYSIDYDDSNFTGDEEFSVSSGSRPFQFNAGNGKYVSQFFPGASTDTTQLNNENIQIDNQQQKQLGELRHTRNKLKLNLSINNDKLINSTIINLSDDSDNDNTINFEINNSSESSKDDSGSNLVSIERSSIESSSELSCNDDLNGKNNNIEINNTSKSSGRPLSIQNNNYVDDNMTSMTHEHHKDDNKLTDNNVNDTVKLSNDESNIINDLTLPNKLNNDSNDLHEIHQ
ncbi:protein PFF0380w-like isoform X2 [Aphidius gifuensis]|uniref:protein PFF0380w-like isoform X2 n=1 Tax=Aphidius gifuensis TaxID=684658 RepID=UPI001CDCC960|nr:protein PFF0380w-like isoform X2 [Aphidius gifuensis]